MDKHMYASLPLQHYNNKFELVSKSESYAVTIDPKRIKGLNFSRLEMAIKYIDKIIKCGAVCSNRNIYFDFTSFSNRHFSVQKFAKSNESDCQYISTGSWHIKNISISSYFGNSTAYNCRRDFDFSIW